MSGARRQDSLGGAKDSPSGEVAPVLPRLDPDVAYARFQAHLRTCPACTPDGECAEGHALLMAWGAADTRANLRGASHQETQEPEVKAWEAEQEDR